MFKKLCKGGAHCFAIVVAKTDLSWQVENTGQESTPNKLELLLLEIRLILEAHCGVLEVPTTLPL